MSKKEIIWNIVNAALAGGLVFLGACSAGNINLQTMIVAGIAALAIMVTKFNDYWQKEQVEYEDPKALSRLFQFI
jgi:uncharacterized membrane protein YebE (DUF533 family)